MKRNITKKRRNPIPEEMKRSVTKKIRLTSETKCGDTKEDIISELPEPVLHHILSFLPTKDATRTTTLSKTWNSVFESIPVMVFDQDSFQESWNSRKQHTGIRKKHIFQDFCKYVDESIARRKGPMGIEKFKIVSRSGPARRKYLDRWLNFATNNNVRDLVLYYYSASCRPKDGWEYDLPRSLLSLSSLESLDLFGCRFGEHFSGLSVGFSLRKLKLCHVFIDQVTLHNVISRCCSSLEELSIVSCKGFKRITVSNCRKLKTVDLYLGRGRDQAQIVAVLAPNLRSVSYGGGIDSVEGSVMASSAYCASVKELKLHDTDITDKFFRVISEFGQLEKMEIERCCLLERVRITSVGLIDLSVSDCVSIKEIELNTCSLRCFRNDGGCDVRFLQSAACLMNNGQN